MENRSRVLFSRREKSQGEVAADSVGVGAQYVPWPQMVRNLFKRDGYASVSFRGIAPGQEPRITVDAPSLMHAAIGVMGEVIELKNSGSRDNTILELGDILFYMEAGIGVLDDAGLWSNAQQEAMTSYVNEMFNECGIPELVEHLVYRAAEFLDQAKRVWIYCNPMDRHAENLMTSLVYLSAAVGTYIQHLGLEPDDILRANQRKLGKRYPNGVYSNTDATTRADES